MKVMERHMTPETPNEPQIDEYQPFRYGRLTPLTERKHGSGRVIGSSALTFISYFPKDSEAKIPIQRHDPTDVSAFKLDFSNPANITVAYPEAVAPIDDHSELFQQF